MSNRNVKQFLPRQFRTNEIRNFMDSTTETLFTSKNSEDVPFYIGRTPGGLFQPFNDYYAEEKRKLREDYQLEQTMIIRDIDSGELNSETFYEDLLNNLDTKGSFVSDHERIFKSNTYSYAPPIDIDMFVNFNNYYWYPEGIMAFHVDAEPNDIIGNVQFQATVIETNEYLMLSSGHHIILNDGKEYIVEGVGRYIDLIEFSLENNKPKRIDRVQAGDSTIDSIIERFPSEYITMERGSIDENPWSRNNAWYHRDVINLQIGQQRFTASRERQARRPIICFDKNLELYNYSNKPFEYVTLFGDSLNIAIDGVVVQVNDLAVQQNDPTVYRFDGNQFVNYSQATNGDKITITDGGLKADEFRWDENQNKWIQCQQKTRAVQSPLFNLYDSNDPSTATLLDDQYRYPNSNFEGNKLFSYKTNSLDGIYDEHLMLNIVYKTFQQSSDIVFENFMNEQYHYEVQNDQFPIVKQYYKKLNPEHITNDNILIFTIHKDENNNDKPTIFINDEKMPNIIVRKDLQYRFDFSDTTTTRRGWTQTYTPITVKDNNGVDIISTTHGDNSASIKTVTFDYDSNNSDNNIYTYTDGKNTGYIIVVDQIVEDEIYNDVWEKKDHSLTTLIQKKVFDDVDEQDKVYFQFEFIPKNDNFIVHLNGERLELNQDFFYEDLKIFAQNFEFSNGDYIEVEYETFETITQQPSETIQMVQDSLSNNPFNEDVENFAFTEIFNHFRSVISNQHYITGSSLSENNYRDTVKDRSKGEIVLKHENSMIPLMFVNDNDTRDVVNSVYNAMRAYTSFKNLIVLNTEEQMKTIDVNNQNARDVFDEILGKINIGKTTRETFSQTYMFATYRKFTNLSIDTNGLLNNYADISPVENELYIFTNQGVQLRGIDYELSNDELAGETTVTPLTFSISDIDEIRYYTNMEPSFCPSTPAKFGLEKPVKPEIINDDSFSKEQYFIVGHDGSKTPVYSTKEQINDNQLDARDLILLEFEKRIFNGIDELFKKSDIDAFDYNTIKEGYFRETSHNLEQFNNTEFNVFHIWSYNNNVNYTKNTLYNEDNVWTYNYSLPNSKLPGHWKGIYEYLYDTHRPDTRPWEMLGFSIKPSWWENEYGTDYSPSNTQLWEDLEEGIIRQGERSNVQYMKYMNVNNPYRRIGLSNMIPVKSNGELKDPVEIGLFNNYPRYYYASQAWEYGDMSPVEQAWKRDSVYSFAKQIVYYLLNPLNYTNKSWDTFKTFNSDTSFAVKISDYSINNQQNNRYVPGITQWIHDYIRENNETVQTVMEDPFNGIDIVLAHKVGGYIDTDNMRVISESYNPRSGDTNSSLPEEDIDVVIHESKDISEEVYSGVIIERVEPNERDLTFIKGALYQTGDIIYIPDEDSYYKNVKSLFDYPYWDEDTTYVEGRAVIFDNKIYNCVSPHSPQTVSPDQSVLWELRGFVSSEWALMFDKPDPKYTVFKVYGYDPYGSQFKTIPAKPSGKKKNISSITNQSRPISVSQWAANTNYAQGTYVALANGNTFRALREHVSGASFDPQYWTKVEDIPYTNVAKTTVGIEGDDVIEVVPYGTVFRTQKQVSELLAAYGRYLESRGWLFDERDNNRNVYKNWILSIQEFIQWAYENNHVGSVISVSPASMNIRFRSEHGVPSISRSFDKNKITLLDNRSRIIEPTENTFNRENDVFQITPTRPIYYARLNVREYEHAMIFNNRTIFSDVLYNPLYGIRKNRLKVNARKTKDWNGKLKANGYIISGSRLLPNYESSINDLKTINDMDAISTQYMFNTLKYHNVGFESRDYLENINMDDKSQIQFYSGFISQKGTTEAFQRILRSDAIEADENMGINEEWAFKEGEFGAVVNNQSIELVINKNDYVSSPQNVILQYNDQGQDIIPSPNDIVINSTDRDKWIMSPSRFSDDGNLWTEDRLSNLKVMPTAGYVKFSDVQYRAYSLAQLNQTIINSGRELTTQQYAWIARDTNEEYGFNVYVSEQDNSINVDEIIVHGKDDTSSMIVRLTNVEENAVYSFYDLGYEYTFTFKRIDENDNLYVALPFNENEYTVIDSELTETDLNNATFIIWKPVRINKYYNTIYNDIQDTIDTFIQNKNINVFDGLRIYLDDSRGDVSYKQTIIDSSPIDYWTFNNEINDTFEGQINSTELISDANYDYDNDQQGLYKATKALAGGNDYDPTSNNWPKSFWTDLGNSLDDTQKSVQFWINNTGDFSYRFNQSVSTTVGSIVAVNTDTNDVYTMQLMVDPPSVGTQWEYKIVYMVNGSIDQQLSIELENGFNQIVINYRKDNNQTIVESYINGRILDNLVSSMSINETNNIHWYGVFADAAEPESNMPLIDHVSIYDNTLNIIDIQQHYSDAQQGILSQNDEGNWAVYEYNSGTWDLYYKEQSVINPNLIKDVTVYDSENNATITQFNIYDPIKGFYPSSLINHIDYFTEYDPAEYNSNSDEYSHWTDLKVGTLWLDTSKLRYIEYENFEIDFRNNLWGSLFPGSEVVVYEWVKSNTLPVNYEDQTKIIDANQYVIGIEYDALTDNYVEFYYFWVKNNTNIPEVIDRNVSAVNVANSIQYPENNGVGFVQLLRNDVFSIVDINNVMVDNDTVLQINYRLENDDSESHSQWKLLSRNSKEIPNEFFDKMVDSMLGYTVPTDANPYGLEVPDTTLAPVNRYGNDNIPRQSWFKDPQTARKIFYEVVNDTLENINVWDTELFWERKVDNVQRDTTIYGLVDWYKEGFDPDTIVRNQITDRNYLRTVPLDDGEYVAVNESVGRQPSVEETGTTIYQYIEQYNTYEKVFESRSALSFNPVIYQRELTPEEAVEMRKILTVIFNYMLVGQYEQLKFDLFFQLVEQVFVEQPNNDWVYPSTYISINQTTETLVPRNLYRQDREQQIIEYVNEAKPFHTKLRTINRTHTREPENVGIFATDFDKPPYLTDNKDMIILQEKTTEKIRYRADEYYRQKIIDSKPYEYWTMDEKYVNNTSLIGYYGISDFELIDDVNALTWFQDVGNGISFTDNICIANGQSEFSYNTTIENFDNSSFNLEWWFIQPNQLPQGHHRFVRVLFNKNNEVYPIEFVINVDSSNNWEYKIIVTNGSNVTYEYTLNLIYTDKANYISFGYDGNNIRIRVNNTLVSEESIDFINILGSNIDIEFGHDGNNEVACFDEIALYNRMLPNSESINHYNGGDIDRAQNEFELQKFHDLESIEVYIEDQRVSNSEYRISNNTLIFDNQLPEPVNYYNNITVCSDNIAELNILNNYKDTRGYMSINKSDMNLWKSTVNQKSTTVLFDRVSLLPTFNLERLFEIHNEIQNSEKPLEALTLYSVYNKGDKQQKLSEIDRIVIQHYSDLLETIVNDSYTETVTANSKKTFTIGNSYTKDNIAVFVNDIYINERYYKARTNNGNIIVEMVNKLYKDDILTVRVKEHYNELIQKSSEVRGLGIPYHSIDEINELPFIVNENTTPVKLDDQGELMLDEDYVEELEESDIEASIVEGYSDFNGSGGNIRFQTPFMEPAPRGVPEERTSMNIKESMCFTFKSNLKVIPRGYETAKPLDIFETVTFDSDGSETEYPITLNVPKEQVLVLVNDDEWVMDNEQNSIQYHYALENDKIIFHKQLNNGDKVVITDRYSAFDLYRDQQLDVHKNIQQGGYDGDMILPDYLNDVNNPDHKHAVDEYREFIVYNHSGKVFFFKCDEKDAENVIEDVSITSDSIELENMTDLFKPVNNENGKLIALYAAHYDTNNKLISSFVEFVYYKSISGNVLNDIKRGIFNTRKKYFDSNKYQIKAYPITIERQMPSFTLIEPYIGINGHKGYPKYGHMMAGKD